MSIRILHTADLHLGAEFKSFHQKADSLMKEAFNAFEKLINYTCDPYNEIDILIIAGDLFDNPRPDLPLLEKVRELFLKVDEKNIKLYILPGNHDSYSYKNSIYRTFKFPGMIIKNPGFNLIDEINIKSQHVFIYSGVYEVNNPYKRALKNFKIIEKEGTHIGILHGTLELKEIKISDRELPFSYEEFAYSGLNYLALGHFHQFKEKEVDNEHKCVYTGSLIPRAIDEYGDRYSAVVEIKQNNSVNIKKIQFSKIRIEKRVIDVIKEDISSIRDLISLLKKGDKLSLLILDLYLQGVLDFSINENELIKILEDHYFYVRINNEAKFIESTVVKQLSREETIRGLFFKKLLEKNVTFENHQRILNQALNLGLRDFTSSETKEEPDFKFHKGSHNIEID